MATKASKEPQAYDNTLKSLFGDEAKIAIPWLLPGAEILSEENIELDRTRLRADLIRKIMYEDELHILNMEFQTNHQRKMVKRLLHYCTGLHYKYELPVLPVILYPFEKSAPVSPYEMKSGKKVRLYFHFEAICLCNLDAGYFVENHAIVLYSVLPAMSGARPELLIQAIREMVQYYSRTDLKHHLSCFDGMLQRTKTMTRQEKRLVEEELRMQKSYDWFYDDNPKVKKRVAKGKKEALAQGKIEGIQGAIIGMLKARFPDLENSVQQKLTSIMDIDELNRLLPEIAVASTMAEVRRILGLPIA